MIGFVLGNSGNEVYEIERDRHTMPVESFDGNCSRTLYITADIPTRPTPLSALNTAPRAFRNHRIDDDHKVLAFIRSVGIKVN